MTHFWQLSLGRALMHRLAIIFWNSCTQIGGSACCSNPVPQNANYSNALATIDYRCFWGFSIKVVDKHHKGKSYSTTSLISLLGILVRVSSAWVRVKHIHGPHKILAWSQECVLVTSMLVKCLGHISMSCKRCSMWKFFLRNLLALPRARAESPEIVLPGM